MDFPNWPSIIESIIREVCPDVDGLPIYLIEAEASPVVIPPSVWAWTGCDLDLLLQDHLESAGQWRGRGFAACFVLSRFDSWQALIGGALHELGHWLDNARSPQPTIDPSLRVLFAALTAEVALSRHQKILTNEQKELPKWFGHGLRFVRGCCHLAYRVSNAIESVRPHHLRFIQPYHSKPFTEQHFIDSLGEELNRAGSIRGILGTSPPRRFVELWEQATS